MAGLFSPRQGWALSCCRENGQPYRRVSDHLPTGRPRHADNRTDEDLPTHEQELRNDQGFPESAMRPRILKRRSQAGFLEVNARLGTRCYEPGDNFWSRQQAQCGPKPWLIAQSVIRIASAGSFGDPLIPLACEKSSHVPRAKVSAGPR